MANKGTKFENNNKRVDNEMRIAQYTAIKEKLAKKWLDSGLTINALNDELNKRYGFELNKETLRKTLSQAYNTLDIYCVMALCRYFNMDISRVLAEPDIAEDNSASAGGKTVNDNNITLSTCTGSNKIGNFDDAKYNGTYRGYFYSSKKDSNSIDEFELVIGTENNVSIAKMTTFSAAIDPLGNNFIDKREFSGYPILAKPGFIFIIFTESSGKCFIFSFNYVQYNSSGMYYRRGAIITQARSSLKQPMVQSFVLFNKTLSEDDKKLLPGLLLLYNNKIHVPARELKKLSQEYANVALLLEKHGDILYKNLEEYYVIKEKLILPYLKEIMSTDDAMETLQLIKSRASDANRIYFPDSEHYANFSKKLMQHSGMELAKNADKEMSPENE